MMSRGGLVTSTFLTTTRWEATNVGFSTISLILSILEISRMATEVLTPFLMLCTHIIKLVLAFAILGLDVTVYLQRTDKHYSIVALALDCGLLAATIATFVYSFKTYRRLLKYEDYAVGGGGGGYGNDLEFGANLGTTISISGGKHTSVISSHSNSSTAYISTTTDNANLKGEIDRVIGAEFGWNEGSKTKGVIVGVGVVPRSSKLESSVDLPRNRSWVTERGNAGGPYASPYDAEEDDGTETVRGSREGSPRQAHFRHGSIPTLIVSGHDEHEGDEDTRALLPGNDGQGGR